ncbi:MAG TPA: SbcC/MukB-like Walker B domain-containing protein [Acidimicrobiales bacterium]|nr:SbcC/MukB-like Walker B domain-containing protein [Acidimicrobiales bacterium]
MTTVTMQSEEAGTASAPDRPARWRPTRAGLVGLWRYWDETFRFHHGRLLLRGANGSGKSMALELLLPLLLDGDPSPHKLTSAAKLRGSLFDRVTAGSDEPTRAGFAWIEFTRGDDTFTAGARIRASQSTRRADVDWFTTTLAVGRGLHLLDADRTPLSRKALVEALGATGRVHGTGEEHRNAVREALFPGFSADRFASVVSALLALRKEKLSQHLDLAKLSATLSESLPPVDDHDVAAVAEGFERLDRRRGELEALEADLAVARQLARAQREYARAVVVGVAGEVRSAESRRDAVTRAERQARAALDEVQAQSAADAAERRAVGERVEAVAVEVDALKTGDAYKSGVALADLRAQARSLRDVAVRLGRAAGERAAHRDGAAADAEEAAAEARGGSGNLALAVDDLRRAAMAAGAGGVVDEAAAVPEADDGERLVLAWVDAHRHRVAEVRTALVAHTRAVDARSLREDQVEGDEAAVERRLVSVAEARAARDAAVAAFEAAVGEWAGRCVTAGVERVRGALPRPAGEPEAVGRAVAGLAAQLGSEDAVARSVLAADRAAAAGERAVLADERARWAEGGLVDPDGPAWRSPRAGRPGAPLWRLVDVAPGVEPAQVDGLEAALTGTGLLDAWVDPDGAVDLGDGRSDLVLAPRPCPGRSLADVLVAADPAGPGTAVVAPGVVAGVLASVPLVATALDEPAGAAEAPPPAGAPVLAVASDEPAGAAAAPPSAAGPALAVALDGTYRLGAATGRGPGRPAEWLGAVARERRRLARLAEIDAALAAVDARLAELDRHQAGLDRHRAAVAAELDAAPSAAAVFDAHRVLGGAEARLVEAESTLARTRQALVEAEAAVREALRALTLLAARHDLPTDPAGLAEVEAGLAAVARAGGTWARRRRDLAAAERQHAKAVARLADAERAAGSAAAHHRDAEREAAATEARVAALEQSVGAEYGEVLRRLAGLEAERTAAQRRERELAEQIPTLERRVGALTTELEAAEAERARAEEERAGSQQRLAAVLAALGDDAAVTPPGPLDRASAVLAAARAIAADHEKVASDPPSVERASERVRERVHAAQAALGARVDVSRDLADEGWWVLRTLYQGRRRGAAALAEALATELAEGRAELAADEEKLFEQTLAGSVRRALAERIRQANALVDGINTQLDAVVTAAGGVHVRLRWEVDPDQPVAVKAARALLLRDPADLSDDERASLQAFVRARVDQARAELEATATWEARLRETLDYRAWHRFTLQLAHRDWDGFQPATARRLQKLSTGERSIALHLPMIASVAAHYAGDDGNPSGCPRLILLDELFAGVDTANRAQLFGTFSTWDLDAVLTSDHEWCQYATLDGIAIHHLHPPAGDEPVTSTRFTWDGRRRLADAPAGPG